MFRIPFSVALVSIAFWISAVVVHGDVSWIFLLSGIFRSSVFVIREYSVLFFFFFFFFFFCFCILAYTSTLLFFWGHLQINFRTSWVICSQLILVLYLSSKSENFISFNFSLILNIKLFIKTILIFYNCKNFTS